MVSLRCIGLAVVVSLGAPSSAPAVDIEAVLEFEPRPLFSQPRQIPTFEFRYAGRSSLSHAEIGALFPPQWAGALRVEWGIRSVDGLAAKFTEPVTWAEGALTDPRGEDAVIAPQDLEVLFQRGVAATVSEVRYQAEFTSTTDGTYTSGSLTLGASAGQSRNVPWNASVTVEFYAVYHDERGELAGELTSDTWGLPTARATVEDDVLPVLVPVESESWGAVKALYHAD